MIKPTLVVDEAVGGEQFEGVDFEQDSVEQKVVRCRTEVGIVAQTRLSELLQRAKRHSQSTQLHDITLRLRSINFLKFNPNPSWSTFHCNAVATLFCNKKK